MKFRFLISLFLCWVLECQPAFGVQPLLLVLGGSVTTPPPPALTSFITGGTLGTARNNANIEVGETITIGASPVTVKSLGRWVIFGNNQTHTLRIRDGSGTDLGNVTVNTSGFPAPNFLFGTLGTPVTLSAGTKYWILSTETFGGDSWYDNDTTITFTAVCSTANSGYYDGTVHDNGDTGHAYVPMNFQY